MIVKDKTKKVIVSSQDIVDVFRSVYRTLPPEDSHKEVCYVAGMDSQNRILYIDLISLGTVNQTSPYTREALRVGIIKNAVSIILCHNHPSGDSKPSQEDRNFTRKLKSGCDAVEMKLLDHVILGDGNYYSFGDSVGF